MCRAFSYKLWDGFADSEPEPERARSIETVAELRVLAKEFDFALNDVNGSYIEFEPSYDGCYYESDSPSLMAKYRPTEHELQMKCDEITKWFKEHQNRQTKKFEVFLNSGEIKRGDILRQRIEQIG